MESFQRYVDAGVRMCLGTDTAPQSMIDGMRWTAVTGKIASRRSDVSTARDVFDAATVNAADSLGRADLGRVQRGAKADLLFWDTTTPRMSPLRDPLRTLVYYATERDLRDVMVNGAWVMRDRTMGWRTRPTSPGASRTRLDGCGRWPPRSTGPGERWTRCALPCSGTSPDCWTFRTCTVGPRTGHSGRDPDGRRSHCRPERSDAARARWPTRCQQPNAHER